MYDLSVVNIPAGLSGADFLAQFDACVVATGLTLYDSYVSGGSTYRVYKLYVNATATGTAYLQYGFTTANLATYIAPSLSVWNSWNAGTHTGTTQTSTSSGITIYPTSPTSAYIFKSDQGEGGFVQFKNGVSTGVVGVVGYTRPYYMPAGYDEATYSYYFIHQAASMNSFSHLRSAIVTTSLTMSTSISSTSPISADSYVRPFVPGTKILYSNNASIGYMGRLSSDWADIPGGSSEWGQILVDASDPSQRYFTITSGAAPHAAVRIR